MCGRYTLTAPGDAIVEAFELEAVPELSPRYNIAPTQEVAIVRKDRRTGKRQLERVRWGLVPSWAQDPSIGNRMINARSETAAEKPAFRSAFKRQRCLVVADGFYEWRKAADGTKQPFLIHLRDSRPFGIAGLWEHWEKGGEPFDSCALLTTGPNELMATIHDRMPVILPPEHFEIWLDPATSDRNTLEALLVPFDAAKMEAYPVSRIVNNPANDSPRCMEPVSAEDAAATMAPTKSPSKKAVTRKAKAAKESANLELDLG